MPGGGNDEQDGNSIRGVDVLQVLKRVQNDSSLSLPQRFHFVLSLVSSPEFLLPIPFSKKAEWLPCSSSNKRNRGRMEDEEKWVPIPHPFSRNVQQRTKCWLCLQHRNVRADRLTKRPYAADGGAHARIQPNRFVLPGAPDTGGTACIEIKHGLRNMTNKLWLQGRVSDCWRCNKRRENFKLFGINQIRKR